MPPKRPLPKCTSRKWRKPDLTVPQILEWVDEFCRLTGRFPNKCSGRIPLTGETWCAIDQALSRGGRGLSGGRSLAKLLSLHLGYRNRSDLPKLTKRQIIQWAKAHFQESGHWPDVNSGEIPGHAGERWSAVNAALRFGTRGLPGQSSLSSLLAAEGLKRHPKLPPALSVKMILRWAGKFHARHGKWPTNKSGAIDESPHDSWHGIDISLQKGKRGLPAGSSLARLLGKPLRDPIRTHLPNLKESQIIRWAKEHFQRTGTWPKSIDGPIHKAPGETWSAVEAALKRGRRGLPPGSSVARLLDAHGLKRNRTDLPPLTVRQILRWADSFHKRYNEWPRSHSGVIEDCPQENWMAVDTALVRGTRGLPGNSSLTAFLNEYRGIFQGKSRRPKSILDSEALRVEDILSWARAHRQRHGVWPKRSAGSIPERPGLTWTAIDSALRRGNRGLPGGTSLSILFREVGYAARQKGGC